MKYILLFAWVLVLFCNCHTSRTFTHNTNSSDTLIRLSAWGLPYFKTLRTQDSLTRKWGFYYDLVIGCGVSEAIIDSLKKDNAIAERPLVARYGKNWNKKFWTEFTIITTTPEDCYPLFHHNKEVEEKRKELQLLGDTLFYHFKLGKTPGSYDVDIVGWQRHDAQKKWVSYYKYHVNYLDLRATLSRKKIRTDTAYLSNNTYISNEDFKAYPRN